GAGPGGDVRAGEDGLGAFGRGRGHVGGRPARRVVLPDLPVGLLGRVHEVEAERAVDVEVDEAGGGGQPAAVDLPGTRGKLRSRRPDRIDTSVGQVQIKGPGTVRQANVGQDGRGGAHGRALYLRQNG